MKNITKRRVQIYLAEAALEGNMPDIAPSMTAWIDMMGQDVLVRITASGVGRRDYLWLACGTADVKSK